MSFAITHNFHFIEQAIIDHHPTLKMTRRTFKVLAQEAEKEYLEGLENRPFEKAAVLSTSRKAIDRIITILPFVQLFESENTGGFSPEDRELITHCEEVLFSPLLPTTNLEEEILLRLPVSETVPSFQEPATKLTVSPNQTRLQRFWSVLKNIFKKIWNFFFKFQYFH